MTVKNAIAKTWNIVKSSDGKRWSAYPAGDAPDINATPSWYPAVGVCVEVPLTQSIGAAIRAAGGNSYPGTDPDDITVAWSGAAIVYIAGLPYFVADGGGHGDSSWNGKILVGPLWGTGADTPTCSVWLAASAVGDIRNASTALDGRQSSVHTYNNLCGVNGILYAMRTDGFYSSGSASAQAFSFTASGQTALADNISTGQYGASAHRNGIIYYIGGNGSFDHLRLYNIAGNSWSTDNDSDVAFGNYVSMAIDSTRGKLLVVGGASGGSTTGAYWDLTALTRQTGIARPGGTNSLEFDPDRDAFIAYQGTLTIKEASASVLAAGSGATWVDRVFTGDTPATATSNGVFGRFRYVPEAKGYFVIPALESSLYFFRSA
jgi:hypothetical protein